MLRLITFDVTNTLLRFRVKPGEKYSIIAKQFGIDLKPSSVQDSFKQAFRKQNILHPNFGAGSSGYIKWWNNVIHDTFKSLDRNIDDVLLTELSHHLIKYFGSSVPFEVIDGAKSTLQTLKQQNIELGIISNYDNRLESILTQLGLRHYFNFVINSYSVKIAKPDPLIFSFALKNFGDSIQPAESLHIGDNILLDYQAARQAGWKSILVNSDFEKQCIKFGVDQCPNSMIKNISEVFDTLKDRNLV